MSAIETFADEPETTDEQDQTWYERFKASHPSGGFSDYQMKPVEAEQPKSDAELESAA